MRLAKAFQLAVAESFDSGILRIGSLRYYARIEDDARRDLSEGQRPVEITNNSGDNLVFGATSFNEFSNAAGAPYRVTDPRIKFNLKPGVRFRFESEANVMVFCTTISHPDCAMAEQSKFGDEMRYLEDAEAFAVAVTRQLMDEVETSACSFRPKTKWARLEYRYGAVAYQEKYSIDHASAEARTQQLRFSIHDAFIKPEIFKPECEFRFIWYFANENGTEMCPLPNDFRYVDIEVPDSKILWEKQ